MSSVFDWYSCYLNEAILNRKYHYITMTEIKYTLDNLRKQKQMEESESEILEDSEMSETGTEKKEE